MDPKRASSSALFVVWQVCVLLHRIPQPEKDAGLMIDAEGLQGKSSRSKVSQNTLKPKLQIPTLTPQAPTQTPIPKPVSLIEPGVRRHPCQSRTARLQATECPRSVPGLPFVVVQCLEAGFSEHAGLTLRFGFRKEVWVTAAWLV